MSKILEEFLLKEGLAGSIKTYQQIERFGELFPILDPFCRCDEYRNGVLFLSISDPVFSLEVQKFIPDIRRVYSEMGIEVKRVKIRGTFKR